MNGILPVHQRLAELYLKHAGHGLTLKEEQEMYMCLKHNAKFCWERAYLENLSLMASMTNDIDWLHEISLEIDNQ